MAVHKKRRRQFVSVRGRKKMRNKDKFIADNPFSQKLAKYLDYNSLDYSKNKREFREQILKRVKNSKDAPELGTIDTWIKWTRVPRWKIIEVMADIMGYGSPFQLFQSLEIDKEKDEFIHLIYHIFDSFPKALQRGFIKISTLTKEQKQIIEFVQNTHEQQHLKMFQAVTRWIKEEREKRHEQSSVN